MKPRYRSMLRKMKERAKTLPAAGTDAAWSLYMLRCGDGSFYTGVTNDVDRRFREHQEGRASRFTRTRRPVFLVYQEKCGSRSQALLRECAVKSMGRKAKEDLVGRRCRRGRASGPNMEPPSIASTGRSASGVAPVARPSAVKKRR